MVQFQHNFNISARTKKEVDKLARKFARDIGMVAEKIRATKKGSARVKGKQVWNVSMILRDKIKKKKR